MKCIIGNKKWVYGFRDELKVTQNIIRSGILFLLSILFINNASAGGFGLGVTRLIYPAESKQITLSVQNSGDNTSYLIQSWVDDSKTEKKSQDFVITPPLFMLPTRKEASLRIMFLGKTNFPTDRETLYWMNVKAIPYSWHYKTKSSYFIARKIYLCNQEKHEICCGLSMRANN